jgi:hypothetical protein
VSCIIASRTRSLPSAPSRRRVFGQQPASSMDRRRWKAGCLRSDAPTIC